MGKKLVPRDYGIAERRTKVLELLEQDLSEREIGRRLGVSHTTVNTDKKAIMAWLAEKAGNSHAILVHKAVKDVKEIKARMRDHVMGDDPNVSISAAGQWLKAQHQLNQLVGAYAPKKQVSYEGKQVNVVFKGLDPGAMTPEDARAAIEGEVVEADFEVEE